MIARLVMGLGFTVFGLNGFFHFMPEPKQQMSEGATALMTGFLKSGYMFPLVAGNQLVVGILLLINRFARADSHHARPCQHPGFPHFRSTRNPSRGDPHRARVFPCLVLSRLLSNRAQRARQAERLISLMADANPTLGNGKICYLEIPALEVESSSTFYQKVFGWQVRRRGDGHLAFDDGVGQVSGTWVTRRRPSTDPGILIYIMVDSVSATIESVVANGGKLVQPIGVDAPEITARFSDSAGNVLGLYQQPEGR
jgi:predicted enzyme related to lactoylglutathione lyase